MGFRTHTLAMCAPVVMSRTGYVTLRSLRAPIQSGLDGEVTLQEPSDYQP